MINKQLTHPESIVVVGGSNDIHKPGGKVLKNIIDGGFSGQLRVLNPKMEEVQGVKSYKDADSLPDTDLAIIAIAAKHTLPVVETLTQKKNTRAFIVLSAGYSEESEEGAKLEEKLTSLVNQVDGALIGPNCIGLLNAHHHSVFTEPIPELDPKGVDFISGSGATAVFILESGIPKGLKFSSLYSVGNSAQMGVEEVLQHMDEHFDPERDAHVKLLYVENIDKPQKLLKHASSLIRKGCRIAAVKAGSSDAGSRAASSHTGALASPDTAVDALFQKAGIVRCYGREELINVAAVFMHPQLKGKNIAIISHAGGPAVMLTDALSNGGLTIPPIEGEKADQLKEELFPGSSVANPVDFLATGTAEQLGTIIDYTNDHFHHIDGMVVIFGTPGLFPIFDAYRVLDEKMKTSKKPIFPVLPSTLTAKKEVDEFLSKGRVCFPDEVMLGNALARVFNTPEPAPEETPLPKVNHEKIRNIIQKANSGYLPPEQVQELLDAAGIPRAGEAIASEKAEAVKKANELGYPIVMKVVGPLHKSDVGGVVLNVDNDEMVEKELERMMKIPETTSILMQPMLKGTELFAGAKYEEGFGHMVLFGIGGIFIEVLKDVQNAISPVSEKEALKMIKKLRSYNIIEGIRGEEGVNEKLFAQTVAALSALLKAAPEIRELDLNPLLGTQKHVTAVDARVSIEK